MKFHFFLLLLFLSNNNSFPLNLGKILTPLNDPHGDQSGGLSSDQFTSNVFCSCSCFRKTATRNHTMNWKCKVYFKDILQYNFIQFWPSFSECISSSYWFLHSFHLYMQLKINMTIPRTLMTYNLKQTLQRVFLRSPSTLCCKKTTPRLVCISAHLIFSSPS